MKIPIRKLKTLVQYAVAGGFVIFVVFVVANFKELDKRTSSAEDESEREPLVKIENSKNWLNSISYALLCCIHNYAGKMEK